jgi:hypothetical protein
MLSELTILPANPTLKFHPDIPQKDNGQFQKMEAGQVHL